MEKCTWTSIVNKKYSTLSFIPIKFATTLALSLICSACASIKNHPYEPQDPLQTVNRASFEFNRQIDKFILKPLATGYKTITPNPVRDCINNFYWNLDEIPDTINNILQLELKATLTSATRFAVNSTIGILGLFDVASHVGFERRDNDFGITLAKYGFTGSPYLVIPFLGPTNARDGLSVMVDYTYFSVWPYMQSVALRNSLLGFDYVRIRANYLNSDGVMNAVALDEYTVLRDAYIQRRALQIEQHGASWDEAKYYEEMNNADLAPDDNWTQDGQPAKPPLTAKASAEVRTQ